MDASSTAGTSTASRDCSAAARSPSAAKRTPPSAISHRRCWWTFRRTRRYPPYSKHTLERKIQSKLMP
jgi:hypothetical protein